MPSTTLKSYNGYPASKDPDEIKIKSFRMVRGSTDRLSCHSSGTAIDLNATKHPLGKAGTFPAEKIPMLRALAKKYGLKWGGDFKSRPDDMHFEVEISSAKAKALIESLGL